MIVAGIGCRTGAPRTTSSRRCAGARERRVAGSRSCARDAPPSRARKPGLRRARGRSTCAWSSSRPAIARTPPARSRVAPRVGASRACRPSRRPRRWRAPVDGARLLGSARRRPPPPARSPSETSHDGALHRRRSGRARSHHGARSRPDRALSGVPLRRLARAAELLALLPAERAHRRHRPAERSTRSWPRCVAAHDARAGRRAAAFGRPVDLERARRAAAPAATTRAFPTRSRPACPPSRRRRRRSASELTLPEVAQSVVLTRTPGRASAMPRRKRSAPSRRPAPRWSCTCRSTCSTRSSRACCHSMAADCPVAVVYRASWPDERIIRGELGTLAALVAEPTRAHGADPGRAGARASDFRDSALYDADYQRRFRGTAR